MPDDVFAILRASRARREAPPAPLPDVHAIYDPCARLTVKPLAGGIPDAPVVQHSRDAYSNVRTCKHRSKCACETTYMPTHRDTHGLCLCPPVDVESFHNERVGIRVKCISAARKLMAKPRALAGNMAATANLQSRTHEAMRPLQARLQAFVIWALMCTFRESFPEFWLEATREVIRP